MPISLDRPVRIGVAGVGHLGVRHLRHLLAIPEVACAGFFDTDGGRAAAVAQETGARNHSSIDSLIEASEAVSIVVPTRAHFDVASRCIEAGRHIFIEKPICRTLEEADRLLELAAAKRVVTQVGHIERLNPALAPVKTLGIVPTYIETHRLAPYTVRGTDVPVVLDLMIHDLDVILAIVRSPVVSVQGAGISIITDRIDIANARLRFANGCVANITSSRIATGSVRKIRLYQKDLYVTIDFLKGITEVYRVFESDVKDPLALATATLERDGRRRQIVYERPEVPRVDALRVEMENFAAAAAGRTRPIVSGQEGRDALEVALLVMAEIEKERH